MARYILLQVPDNEVAEQFVSAVNSGVVFFGTPVDGLYADQIKYAELTGAEVRGFYGRPTIFCDCGSKDYAVNSAKFAWNVCPSCHKARPGQHWPQNLLKPYLPGESKIDYLRRARTEYIVVDEGLGDKSALQLQAERVAVAQEYHRQNYKGKRG